MISRLIDSPAGSNTLRMNRENRQATRRNIRVMVDSISHMCDMDRIRNFAMSAGVGTLEPAREHQGTEPHTTRHASGPTPALREARPITVTAMRRGKIRCIKLAASRLARPGTMLGVVPKAASASETTSAGSISGTNAERDSSPESLRYLGVLVAPARHARTSIPCSPSSPHKPSAKTVFHALLAP